MARKAAHDQRSVPTDWQCTACRGEHCSKCIDVTRRKALGPDTDPLCHCKRRDHNFESVTRNEVEVPHDTTHR